MKGNKLMKAITNIYRSQTLRCAERSQQKSLEMKTNSTAVRGLPFLLLIVLLCASGCAPDLAITGGSFTPSAPKEGDVMNINLTIKNNGGAPANNAKISIFFEVARTAYAPPSGSLPIATLPPGAQTSVSFQWPLKPGWGNKHVHLFAEADVGNAVQESNEQNNRFDFGNLFILPVTAVSCQNNQLIIPRYRNKLYQCFDIRATTLSSITSSLQPNTERVFLYGDFTGINSPVGLLEQAYKRISFMNNTQFGIQVNNVGAPPIFDFKDPANPWNLVTVTVYDNTADLQADCGGAGVEPSACAGGYNIAISENGINPVPGIFGITKGNINYYYSVNMPVDCLPIEMHEFQHIIDRLYLRPHPGWLEEMLARLFENDSNLLPMLCPNVQFTNIQKQENGQTQFLTTLPSLWEINSTLPLENFGTFYTAGDPCKEAIILQINRDALAGGQAYLRKLFSILSSNPIDTNQEIAQAVLLAHDNDLAIRAFLSQNGCLP